jgi:hypothetical protein
MTLCGTTKCDQFHDLSGFEKCQHLASGVILKLGDTLVQAIFFAIQLERDFSSRSAIERVRADLSAAVGMWKTARAT